MFSFRYRRQTFPLLKLPEIPRDRALRQMDPVELFELSLLSSKMADLVRSLKIESKIEVTYNSGQKMIAVSFARREQGIIWWDFSPFTTMNELDEQRTIGGITFFNCQKCPQNILFLNEFYCRYDNVDEGMAVVSKHFHYIFPGTLMIDCAPRAIGNLGDFFSHEHFHRCISMDLSGTVGLSCEDVVKIFEKVTIEKKLSISAECSDKVPILQALEVETLRLADARWMTRDHLLRLNCRFVDLRTHNFSMEDLEAFVKSWKQGDGASLLERISFGWDQNRPVQLKELETSAWKAEVREKSYVYKENNERARGTVKRVDCEKGSDVTRRQDGLLATLVFEEGTPSSLSFLVWHERFPERKRLEALPEVLAPYYRKLEKLNQEYPDSNSLERMLANPSLRYDEYVRTYQILKNMDAEYHPTSLGRTRRRGVFDIIYTIIDLQEAS